MADPKIKLNEVDFFEIDTDREPYIAEAVGEEVAKENDEFNEKYIENELNQECLRHAMPCQCRAGEFMMKQQKRAQLLNLKPGSPYMAKLDQEDVDAFKYGIIVEMSNGRYTRIPCVVTECKRCHEIKIYGDSTVLTRLLAESFTHYVSSNDDGNEEGSNPLQEMLNSGEYEMTDIPEEEPEEEKSEPAE